MTVFRQPYPLWRGFAASLILHAGLLGGLGAQFVSSRDEAPADLVPVELVVLPSAPAVAAASPAAPTAPVAPPAVANPGSASAPVRPARSARPVRTHRPLPPMAAAVAPVEAEASPSGSSADGDSAPVSPGSAAGEGGAVAATGSPSAGSVESDAVPMAGNPPPLYPMSARRAGREGRTVLLVSLSPAGECVEVSVAESSGTPSLDDSAVQTVKGWRFHPAIRQNQPVAVKLRVPILFSLKSGLSGLPVIGQR